MKLNGRVVVSLRDHLCSVSPQDSLQCPQLQYAGQSSFCGLSFLAKATDVAGLGSLAVGMRSPP